MGYSSWEVNAMHLHPGYLPPQTFTRAFAIRTLTPSGSPGEQRLARDLLCVTRDIAPTPRLSMSRTEKSSTAAAKSMANGLKAARQKSWHSGCSLGGRI